MDESHADKIAEADAYSRTYTSAVWSAMRLTAAMTGFVESEVLFLHKYGNTLADPSDKLYEDMRTFAESGKTPRPSVPKAVTVHWYKQITTACYFVYATTLFDAFISDTTRFLYLRDLGQLQSAFTGQSRQRFAVE
jgi:hypothetical protein